jgi:GMP synthase (glutamine-hydrolysing)
MRLPPSRIAERKMWAVQFHPEVHHTPLGTEILRNFVFDICGMKPTGRRSISSTRPSRRSPASRQRPGDLRAFRRSGFVSRGGAGASRHRDQRLTCVFVNNGVLRKNEFIKCSKICATISACNIVAVDATERFMSKLAGVTDPEKKRKIIGNEFIAVFEEEAHRIEKEEGKLSGWCRARSILT